MARKFYIDQDECIADGSCAEICPECFRFEEDMDAAEVISFDCPEATVQQAIEECPAQCIHWQED